MSSRFNRRLLSHGPRLCRVAAWLLLALCRTVLAGRTFRSDALPREFQAPPVGNGPQAVDLSRLGGLTVSNELIANGDVLEITVGGGYSAKPELTTPVRVGEDGVANVPFVGQVPLAGLDLPASEQAIRTAAVVRGVFRDAHVTVVMKQKCVNRVTVVGAVEKPGIYELPRGSSDLLSAVVLGRRANQGCRYCDRSTSSGASVLPGRTTAAAE